MSFLRSIYHFLGFTRNEIIVILCLSTSFFVGSSFRWYQSQTDLGDSDPNKFDYSESDSIFLERSKKLTALAAPQSKSKSADQKSSAKKSLPQLGSVNVNTATKEQLMRLPGIGESYAERIIISREDYGPYRKPDDLLRVKGIGKKTLEKILPYITLK